MHVNMKVFKIKVSRRDDDKDRHLQLEFRLQNDKMDYPISPMLFSEEHIDHLVSQLEGKVKWNLKYSFSDISYQIVGVGTDGMRIWHSNGGKLDDLFFHFPGKEAAREIKLMCARAICAPTVMDKWGQNANPSFEHDFSDKIEQWTKQYAPRFQYEFNDRAKERYLGILRQTNTDEHAELLTDENRAKLKEHIQGLKSWATNRSNGEAWTIEVYTDFVEFSFGWTIYNGNHERVINGGLIAHALRDGPQEKYYEKPIVGYEYSMHT